MKQIVLALIMMIGLSSFAQPGQRIAAKKCIRRTTVVMMHAHKLLKENKVYTGNMVKSVRHQRYARFLFRKGKFLRAIHQSRRARQLAFLVISANKGTANKDWELSSEENPSGGPTDAELEKELPPDTENSTDEKLASTDLKDIDVEEKE